MGMWAIGFGPREYEPGEGRDSDVGWGYDIEREGVHGTIAVEVSRALAAADKSTLSKGIRAALRTRGRSAVVPMLVRDAPPCRLVLDVDGIAEIEG